MGGEYYHYKRVDPEKAVTREGLEEYKQLLPKFVETVLEWWNSYPQDEKHDWEVKANLTDGVYIKSPIQSNPIADPVKIPIVLDDSFEVGWRHRRFGFPKDPKEAIVEELFKLIDSSKVFKLFIEDLEEYDDEEVGGIRYKESKWYKAYEHNRNLLNSVSRGSEFTPCSDYYPCGGDGSMVFCQRGEEQDLTACGSDCGYCGRCQY
jgi:hypothetical protein